MPDDSQVSIARIEAKLDGLIDTLNERQKGVERRIKSLESSRAKLITWVAGLIGSMLITGIYLLGHAR